MLTVAIIGRPNVGKSTFFNRVLNQRKAIVHEKEGISIDSIKQVIDEVKLTNAAMRIAQDEIGCKLFLGVGLHARCV